MVGYSCRVITYRDEIRAVYFAFQTTDGRPSGQRGETWLPKGEYTDAGLCELSAGWNSPGGTAQKIIDAKGNAWYVRPGTV